MRYTEQELIALLAQPLPGEPAHVELFPYRAASSIALQTAENVRMSAVAIVLFHREERLQTIVIQRQVYEGTHSGQVSFPGGKWEQQDASLQQTALRECNEEIGLAAQELHSIGKLTNVFIPVSNFLIEPYVFYWLQPHNRFVPSEREVAAIHTVDLETLFDQQALQELDIQLSNGQKMLRVPHFVTEDVRIWGATALILNELKRVFYPLQPPVA